MQALKLDLRKETNEWPTTPCKYVGLGAAIAAELKIGFWFDIGVILAVGVVNSLSYCTGVLMSNSSQWVATKMEGPGQVTMKDPKGKDLKKVEVGKRLAEYNHRKREELAKAQKSEPELTSSHGPFIAIGALGILGYCIHQSKKEDVT